MSYVDCAQHSHVSQQKGRENNSCFVDLYEMRSTVDFLYNEGRGEMSAQLCELTYCIHRQDSPLASAEYLCVLHAVRPLPYNRFVQLCVFPFAPNGYNLLMIW